MELIAESFLVTLAILIAYWVTYVRQQFTGSGIYTRRGLPRPPQLVLRMHTAARTDSESLPEAA